jgi:Flp pilus assembly pilin Flp
MLAGRGKCSNHVFAKHLHDTGRESTGEGIDNPPVSAHYEFLTEDISSWRSAMYALIEKIWSDEQGQDIAEYAVMLAVILVLVVGTIRLVGSNANNAFSSVASSIN